MRKKYHPKSKIELRKLILDEEIELASIDTSKITDMSHLFEPTLRSGEQARFFYDGIETWDVSHVTDMSYMFCYARNFNADISQWDVSNVKNMRGMFQFASSFNQNIGMWNVSKVENMASMFYDAAAFNQNLDEWDVSKVKTMRFMFMYARYFEKKPVWDMSNVEDQVGMYYGSPIVYVDPNTACGVDPVLEAQAENESIQKQLEETTAEDGIANFAKNLSVKSSTIADRLEAKFDGVKSHNREEDESIDDSTEHTKILFKSSNIRNQHKIDESVTLNDAAEPSSTSNSSSSNSSNSDVIEQLERLKKLRDSGMINDEELLLLKSNILSKITQ